MLPACGRRDAPSVASSRSPTKQMSAQYTMPTGDRSRMPTRTLARLASLTLTLALTASVAQAQPPTGIGVRPGAHADARARVRWLGTAAAPAQPARKAAPNVVVVTTEAAKLSGQPGVSGLD